METTLTEAQRNELWQQLAVQLNERRSLEQFCREEWNQTPEETYRVLVPSWRAVAEDGCLEEYGDGRVELHVRSGVNYGGNYVAFGLDQALWLREALDELLACAEERIQWK